MRNKLTRTSLFFAIMRTHKIHKRIDEIIFWWTWKTLTPIHSRITYLIISTVLVAYKSIFGSIVDMALLEIEWKALWSLKKFGSECDVCNAKIFCLEGICVQIYSLFTAQLVDDISSQPTPNLFYSGAFFWLFIVYPLIGLLKTYRSVTTLQLCPVVLSQPFCAK